MNNFLIANFWSKPILRRSSLILKEISKPYIMKILIIDKCYLNKSLADEYYYFKLSKTNPNYPPSSQPAYIQPPPSRCKTIV